jgi:hypothetical protein
MKCSRLKHGGQRDKTFHNRIKLHIQAIRNNNNSNDGYASNILNTGHTYGSTTNTTGTVTVRQYKKVKHLTYWKNTIYTKSVKITYT